jgi:hypothetical protein
MIKVKPLGILYKNNKVVNHRSLIKILFNPILRCFGICIGSKFDKNVFQKYEIIKDRVSINIFKNYYNSIFTCNDYDFVEK